MTNEDVEHLDTGLKILFDTEISLQELLAQAQARASIPMSPTTPGVVHDEQIIFLDGMTQVIHSTFFYMHDGSVTEQTYQPLSPLVKQK